MFFIIKLSGLYKKFFEDALKTKTSKRKANGLINDIDHVAASKIPYTRVPEDYPKVLAQKNEEIRQLSEKNKLLNSKIRQIDPNYTPKFKQKLRDKYNLGLNIMIIFSILSLGEYYVASL